MYMYACKKVIKTTYYLRSRPATSITKTTVKRAATAHPNAVETTTMMMESTTTTATAVEVKKEYSDSEIIACSLENPEACEACQ